MCVCPTGRRWPCPTIAASGHSIASVLSFTAPGSIHGQWPDVPPAPPRNCQPLAFFPGPRRSQRPGLARPTGRNAEQHPTRSPRCCCCRHTSHSLSSRPHPGLRGLRVASYPSLKSRPAPTSAWFRPTWREDLHSVLRLLPACCTRPASKPNSDGTVPHTRRLSVLSFLRLSHLCGCGCIVALRCVALRCIVFRCALDCCCCCCCCCF
ncbi:hypothetical protein T440DRAFT_216265 [Plenodomus tracheiphilus IPT5]|uniref:Uncharacterized protein n=1 Tax=Plenodomus tracheiphilus IPT5 TaxID=1408161 RepID=A0A6A7AUU2_9PLEO|nr:hypothetical protein T440DRAFT_216265 [Plenodomus tracheiphilus IPT5]